MTQSDISTDGAPSQVAKVIVLLRLEGAAMLGARFRLCLARPVMAHLRAAFAGARRLCWPICVRRERARGSTILSTLVGPALLALAGLALGPWAFGVIGHMGRPYRPRPHAWFRPEARRRVQADTCQPGRRGAPVTYGCRGVPSPSAVTPLRQTSPVGGSGSRITGAGGLPMVMTEAVQEAWPVWAFRKP